MPESLYRPKHYHVRRPGDWEPTDQRFDGPDAIERAVEAAYRLHDADWSTPVGVYDGPTLVQLWFMGDVFRRVEGDRR